MLMYDGAVTVAMVEEDVAGEGLVAMEDIVKLVPGWPKLEGKGSITSKCFNRRYRATASLMRLKTTQNVSISMNNS